jgi:hypothetical protein
LGLQGGSENPSGIQIVRFEVFTAVRLIRCSSGFWRRADSSVDANVSEKHCVSIFRVEVTMLRSGWIYIVLEEGKAEYSSYRKFEL